MADEIHVWAPSFRAFGGGVTAFSRELALALAEHHTVRLLGKGDLDGTWSGLPLNGSAGWTTRFIASLLTAAISRRPHMIVSTHVNFGPIAHWVSRACGMPYVLVAHGIDVGAGLGALRLRALRAADSVWAVSRWTRERLLGRGVARERMSLVPNTVDAHAFYRADERDRLRARYSITRGEKVVLTVARLDRREGYKGHDRLLRALPYVVRIVGPMKYLLVGTGDDEARLRSLAAACGVERYVTFCGFVPDQDLPAYYTLADAFAMPSVGEGFGVVFLEAMACGTPVLGGDSDGTPDALADGKLGVLVDPMSVSAIADGLVRLLLRQGPSFWFDPERLQAECLGLHGRERFRGRVRDALQACERGWPSRGSSLPSVTTPSPKNDRPQ